MAVRGSIKGRVELREVITRLEVTAPAQLEKDLLAGTRDAVKGIKPDVQASALAKLPKRHGYAVLVSRAIKVSSRVTGGKKILAVVWVTASGKRENRDLPRMNQGELRHPVFGRRRLTKKGWIANPWKPTWITRGLVDEPIDLARDRVVENAQQAADAYADSIVRG